MWNQNINSMELIADKLLIKSLIKLGKSNFFPFSPPETDSFNSFAAISYKSFIKS